jgi:hypothetical protein
VSGTPSSVLLGPAGIVQHYQSGYTVESGLRIDGWGWHGGKRAAAPAEKPAEAERRH